MVVDSEIRHGQVPGGLVYNLAANPGSDGTENAGAYTAGEHTLKMLWHFMLI